MPTLPFLTPSFGIAYGELARGKGNESGRETYEVEGANFQAKRVFVTAWWSRHLFLIDIIGGIDSGGNSVPPASYPDVPAMRAVSAEVEGSGVASINTATQQVFYPYATITVSYSTAKSDQSSPSTTDRFTENLSFSAQAVTMPDAAFRFPANADVYGDDGLFIGSLGSDASPIESQPGKIMPTASYSLAIRDILSAPFADINSLVGTVNNAVFTPLAQGFSFEAGTLLFEGVDTEKTTSIDATGNPVSSWSFTYKWNFRRIPWNFVFNPLKSRGSIGWVKVQNGDGGFIFAEKNHDLLTLV